MNILSAAISFSSVHCSGSDTAIDASHAANQSSNDTFLPLHQLPIAIDQTVSKYPGGTMRSIVIVLAASALLSCANPEAGNDLGAVAQAAEDEHPATPTKFIFGSQPGQLTIDASGTNVLFPLPAQVRSFATWNDFTAFAVSTLNAEVEYDNNTPARVYVQVHQDGLPYYADQNNQTAVPIRNPIAAFLGGTAGYFTVGSQRIDVRDPNSSDPFNSLRRCDPSRPTFCLNGLTSLTHLGFYHNVGADSMDVSTGADAPRFGIRFVSAFPFLMVFSSAGMKSTTVNATWTGAGIPTRTASMASSLTSSCVTVTDTEIDFFGCGRVCRITRNTGSHSQTDLSPAGTSLTFTTVQ